jgi:YD repeat-containing protein
LLTPSARLVYKDTSSGRYTWTYDAIDQLASEWNPSGLTTWTYDAAFRRTVQVVSPNTRTTYQYDPADQLTQSLNPNPVYLSDLP